MEEAYITENSQMPIFISYSNKRKLYYPPKSTSNKKAIHEIVSLFNISEKYRIVGLKSFNKPIKFINVDKFDTLESYMGATLILLVKVVSKKAKKRTLSLIPLDIEHTLENTDILDDLTPKSLPLESITEVLDEELTFISSWTEILGP